MHPHLNPRKRSNCSWLELNPGPLHTKHQLHPNVPDHALEKYISLFFGENIHFKKR